MYPFYNGPCSACSLSEEESIRANVTFMNPMVEFYVELGGETDSIIQFMATSTVTSARVFNISFVTGAVAIGSSGLEGGSFVIGESDSESFVGSFFDSVEGQLVNTTNEFLENEMPYAFVN